MQPSSASRRSSEGPSPGLYCQARSLSMHISPWRISHDTNDKSDTRSATAHWSALGGPRVSLVCGCASILGTPLFRSRSGCNGSGGKDNRRPILVAVPSWKATFRSREMIRIGTTEPRRPPRDGSPLLLRLPRVLLTFAGHPYHPRQEALPAVWGLLQF